jgi:hypothetical protein
MIAIETLAQPPNDLSLTVNTQTRSVLEILALAILPTPKVGENKATRVGRIVRRLPAPYPVLCGKGGLRPNYIFREWFLVSARNALVTIIPVAHLPIFLARQ